MTRSNGFKLKKSRIKFDIKKHFFIFMSGQTLKRVVVDIVLLEMFKVRLDGALSNLI